MNNGNKNDYYKKYEEFENNLKILKDIIKQNSNLLRFISFSRPFKSLSLISSITIFIFSLTFYFLIEKFNDFNNIPFYTKTITFILLFIAIVILGYIKIKGIMQEAAKIDSSFNFFKLLKSFYNKHISIMYFAYFFTIIFLLFFLINNKLSIYIINMLSILFGLFILQFTYFTFSKEFIILGFWLLLTGLITLFFINIFHPLIILSITFGFGFLLMYFTILIFETKHNS